MPFCIASVAHELAFWKGFVQTPRFLNGWVPDTRTPELQPEVFDFVNAHRNGGRVLDVGSGAVSILRGTVPASSLDAADPLSPLYEVIFDYARHGLTPPFPLDAEDLPEAFRGKYSIVHISNALDHCVDPYRAACSLLACVAPGGHLIVCGFENEAIAQNGAGMHRWNITLEGTGLIIRPAGSTDSVTPIPGDVASARTLENGRRWLFWARRND